MTRLRSVLLLPLIVLALVACGDPNTSGPSPEPEPGALDGVIVGTVTNADGAVVAGQQVELARAGTLTTASVGAANLTFSDEFGRFAFDVDEAGEYTLVTLTDSTGAVARVNVTENADGSLSASEVSLRSAELGAVSGAVDGQGAGVMVYLVGTSFLALTDADGKYVISRVPAGDYQVRAHMDGISSAAVSVTVEAGKSSTAGASLQLAPTITDITPEGLIGLASGEDVGPSPVISIEGSGFGSSQGASRLLFFGAEVPRHAVLSWSDTRVEVDLHPLAVWFVSALRGHLELSHPYDLDDMRFQIETTAGTATSGLSGFYQLSMEDLGIGEIAAFVHVLAFSPMAGLALEPQIVNGRAVDETGAPLESARSVDHSDWDISFIVLPDSNMPVLARFSVDDPRFIPMESEPVVYQRTEVTFDDLGLPGPDGIITGTLLAHDFAPLPEYEGFTFRYGMHPEISATPTFEANGTFTVTLPLPEGYDFPSIEIEVLYRGVVMNVRTLGPIL